MFRFLRQLLNIFIFFSIFSISFWLKRLSILKVKHSQKKWIYIQTFNKTGLDTSRRVQIILKSQGLTENAPDARVWLPDNIRFRLLIFNRSELFFFLV